MTSYSVAAAEERRGGFLLMLVIDYRRLFGIGYALVAVSELWGFTPRQDQSKSTSIIVFSVCRNLLARYVP